MAGQSPSGDSAHAEQLLNMQDVFEEMYEARDKWQNIWGIFAVFGLSDTTLSSIAQEESSTDGRLCCAVRAWLEMCRGTPSATWAEVARTLRNETVGRDDLARKVEEKFDIPQPARKAVEQETLEIEEDQEIVNERGVSYQDSYKYLHANNFSYALTVFRGFRGKHAPPKIIHTQLIERALWSVEWHGFEPIQDSSVFFG